VWSTEKLEDRAGVTTVGEAAASVPPGRHLLLRVSIGDAASVCGWFRMFLLDPVIKVSRRDFHSLLTVARPLLFADDTVDEQ
jgi:hypothetical protein